MSTYDVECLNKEPFSSIFPLPKTLVKWKVKLYKILVSYITISVKPSLKTQRYLMKFSILLKLIFLFTGYLLLKMCHLIFSTIWFVTHYSCVTHRFDPVSIRPSRDIRPYVTRLLSPYTGLVLARGTILSRYVSDQEIVVWRTIELLPTRLNLDICS